MSILKPKEIKVISKEELEKKLKDLRLELMKANSQRATKTNPENPGKIKEIRRTIARINTQLKNKQ